MTTHFILLPFFTVCIVFFLKNALNNPKIGKISAKYPQNSCVPCSELRNVGTFEVDRPDGSVGPLHCTGGEKFNFLVV